jgi:hypothetical protein
MWSEGIRRRAWSWRGGVLQTVAVIALVAGWSGSPVDRVEASVPAPAGVAQTANADPCRFATAETVGKAFGRQMKSVNRVNACEYRGAGTDIVAVKVEAGPEGTFMRHAKDLLARGLKQVTKVPTTAGEAYFDEVIPIFIGRVGNQDVQVETSIEPAPREAMIAVGTGIMEALARR